MAKENKELKLKRKQMLQKIENDYLAKKKKYPAEIPKYAKATNLDLDSKTYKAIMNVKKILTPQEKDEILNNEQIHNQKCA